MRSVVFKGPKHVSIEERPVPALVEAQDVIIRVKYTALCGSELHVFRGHQASGVDFIMGHEFTGTIVETGSDVKRFRTGDQIVSPFTISCGNCFYCQHGRSSRCERSLLFGTPSLDGAQSEYVRVPLADSTLEKAPTTIDEKKLVLMADIFPTGYFAASNALAGLDPTEVHDSTVVVIGCGPVGLCALINVLEYKPKHVLALDTVDSRLRIASDLGAETWNSVANKDALYERIKTLTDGRGADAVIEVVGLSPALRTAFEILRPWGTISSVGVHNAEIPWTGNEAYGKNLKIQMGRCPVRSIFTQALKVLERNQHKLDFMTNKILPLSQAVEGYEIFDGMRAEKVIFEAEK